MNSQINKSKSMYSRCFLNDTLRNIHDEVPNTSDKVLKRWNDLKIIYESSLKKEDTKDAILGIIIIMLSILLLIGLIIILSMIHT